MNGSAIDPAAPLQSLKGVGPARAELLASLGLATVEDALYFFPFRYEDRTRLLKIRELVPGACQTVAGQVRSGRALRIGRGPRRGLYELRLEDETGVLTARWFNQPYLGQCFRIGQSVILTGRVQGAAGRPVMLQPEFEIEDRESAGIHTGRIVPIYHLTRGVGQKTLRGLLFRLAAEASAAVADVLPPALARARELMPVAEAIRQVHFPPPGTPLEELARGRTPAHRRLVYEQALLLQLALWGRRRERESESRGRSYRLASPLARALRERLPFQLTRGQIAVLREILADLGSERPMNRLLQGEVGSGKTIVALLAMLVAIDSGAQAALMAPTEVLAEQHHANLARLLDGLIPAPLLLTGAVKGPARRAALAAVASGAAQLVVGTHALIQPEVAFARLGLVVVDEQHRFGVLQRARLLEKGAAPDVLVMTATPIPRTLALAVFGDLDVSTLRELPPGRQPVATEVVPPARKGRVVERLRSEIARGRQAYVICPVIEGSERSDLAAAAEVARILAEQTLPEARVGLLHGRLKPPERLAVMSEFAAGRIDVLVSTTVVEVGVDVKNATVMVVGAAERFGLAQLHQLRGRVGRGVDPSVCFLLAPDEPTPEAEERLAVLAGTGDGFEIAEADLALRGPGEFLGVRQSGLPEAALLGILRYEELLEAARDDARALSAAGPLPPPLAAAVERRWGRRFAGLGA